MAIARHSKIKPARLCLHCQSPSSSCTLSPGLSPVGQLQEEVRRDLVRSPSPGEEAQMYHWVPKQLDFGRMVKQANSKPDCSTRCCRIAGWPRRSTAANVYDHAKKSARLAAFASSDLGFGPVQRLQSEGDAIQTSFSQASCGLLALVQALQVCCGHERGPELACRDAHRNPEESMI